MAIETQTRKPFPDSSINLYKLKKRTETTQQIYIKIMKLELES